MKLFTGESRLDSITVGHRLVEDVRLLMDCFRYISGQQSFQPARYGVSGQYFSRGYPRSQYGASMAGRRDTSTRGLQVPPLLTRMPQWLSPNTGFTLVQWLVAFMEQLIISRYIRT